MGLYSRLNKCEKVSASFQKSRKNETQEALCIGGHCICGIYNGI